jgi:PAS domain S-box-containing protein
MFELPGYTIKEKLFEDSVSLYYRAARTPQASSYPTVIVRALRGDGSDVENRARLQHEYDIVKQLEHEYVLKPLELLIQDSGIFLIFEDFHAEPLASHIDSGSIELLHILQTAVRLSDTLGYIHGEGIIHSNIKPQNILVDKSGWQIKLTGFDIASRFSVESTVTDTMVGTPAYMSPEQTGRMNRVADYRSDLYSLGAVMYELLTGQPPFREKDTLALVHALLAINPVPPHEMNVEVPEVMSAIVMKLLSKSPEKRYQSSYGLGVDLRRCLAEIQRTGRLTLFEPGEYDPSPLFTISQNLYGRQDELYALRDALDHVRQGGGRFVLIGGKSGIGKTSLVREFQRSLAPHDAGFVTGTFDQLQKQIPYSGFIQAFGSLVDHILLANRDKVSRWRDRLRKALGPNGQIIVDVIPQVEHIVGEQKPAALLPPAQAMNRFQTVFQNFVGAFSSIENPLIIFLDNLHWADTASLKLLHTLISGPVMNGMLVLGAYRDDEVEEGHPLRRMLNTPGYADGEVVAIDLKPLSLDDVEGMVSNILKCTREESASLTQLVQSKTGGNPFFINEFLKNLNQNGHVVFDFSTGHWVWDVDEIIQADIADDLIGLMIEKIRGLSTAGQRVLMHAACIGSSFTLKTLAAVHDVPLDVCNRELQESLRAGLVLEDKKAAGLQFTGETALETSTGAYKFLHDRVQQTASSLLSREQSRKLHLGIGRVILEQTDREHLDEFVCEIADHMNRGRSLISDKSEKLRLAELNLRAGKKTKSSVAYDSALRYITAGIDLLGDEGWQHQYDLMLSLHLEGAEAAYLSSNHSDSEGLKDSVLLHATSLLDRVMAYEIYIHSLISQNSYEDAVAEASGVLNQLGVFLPKSPGRLRVLLGLIRTKILLHGISLQDLKNLPPMTDPYKKAAMRILMGVFNPFYRSIREMFPSIAFRMLILSYKYGNSSISPFTYALYGLLLGLIGEVEQGYQFGSFALDLFEKYHSKELTAKMFNVVYALMNKWKSHLCEALNPLVEAYNSGLETGDLEWAAYAARSYCMQHFFVGADMEALKSETATYGEKLKAIHQFNTYHTVMLVRQTVLNLMGGSDDCMQLRGESFNDEEMIPLLIEAKDTDTIAGIRFFKSVLCFIFDETQHAYELFLEVERQGETRGQFGFVLEVRFYYALILLSVIPDLHKSERRRCMNLVISYQKMMKKGADTAPMNYLHKWQLVEAEREKIVGRDSRAMDLYEKAIEGARMYGYHQDEALANELAAKFYLGRGRGQRAAVYLKEARDCYEKWGAHAKVRSLEQKYGDIMSAPLQTKTLGERAESPLSLEVSLKPGELDLATMLKVSQVLSGEIMIDSLLRKTTQMVLESSGAERGLLILEQEGRYLIEAEGDAKTGSIELLENLEVSHSGKLSQAVFNFAIRTKQNIIQGDAREDELFMNDPYIKERGIRSLLCAPIIHQGQIKGVIYLENNLTSGVFTEGRVEIVTLVASQAAISLENARLYQTLLADIERRKKVEAELRSSEQMATSLLDALRDSLVLIDTDGVVLSLNTTTARRLNMKHERILGARLWDLYTTELAERRLRLVETAVRTVRAVREVEEHEGRISDIVIYPVVDDGGRVTRIAILERDITEQRKVEEQARVQELHLMRSDRLATMGMLSAGVAHEISTPNHSIMLNTGLLLKAYPDILKVLDGYSRELEGFRIGGFEYNEFKNKFEDSVKRVEQCAKRIASIVEEMKSFAGPEAESISDPVDVNVAVQSAILLGTPFIKRSTDHFTIQLEEKLPKVRGNAQKIEQVLINLIQNGCQSLKDRSRGLSIATQYNREQRVVTVEVRDEGEGMTEEVLARVTEPFFTTKRETGGTGLGLSISSRIVDEHGGSMQFQSQPGKGTVVTVSFPERL